MPKAYIATIGPEIKKHGDKVLRDGVEDLERRYPEHVTVAHGATHFPDAYAEGLTGEHDVVYLVAHGDDPKLVSTPRMGDKTGPQIASILKSIFSGFRGNQKFRGHIVLEGCFTAVHPYSDEEETHNGKSLLELVQEAMARDLEPLLDPQVTIAGYRGSNYSDSSHHHPIYNAACIESPFERERFHKSYHHEHIEKNTTVYGEKAVVETRWKRR
jgi:hypothetical protein